MAVAYRSATTSPGAESNTFNTDLLPADPAGLTTGDVQILIELLTGFGTSATLPTLKALTTGWTQILDTGQVGPGSNNRVGRMRISWALHDALDPTSDTNTDGANMGGTPTATGYLARAIRLAFSGVDTAYPIDVSRSNASESPDVTASFSQTGVTTTVDNAMVVQVTGITDDNTATSQAFANGPTLTEQLEYVSATGGDSTIVVCTGTLTTAGATGTFTATHSDTDLAVGAIFALNPSGGAPHTPSSVSASASGQTSATTGATMPTDTDVTKYRVRYKSGSGQSFSSHTDGTAVATDVATTPGAVLSGVSVTGLSAGSTYTVGWFAGDSGGNYSAAGTANVTTDAAATTSRKHALRAIVARRRRR